MVSPSFQVQHMIYLNDSQIYKGTACFVGIYLHKGDKIEVKVRTGTDPDGYIMLTGIPGDGQNCSASITVYPIK